MRFTKSGIDQFELREVHTTIILQTNQVINSDYMIYKDFIPILDLIKYSIKLRLLTNEVAALKDL